MTEPCAPPAPRPRVALVVGAGAIKCAAAIGAYRALTDAGVGVDLAVGCSAGSLYAAGIALGYDAERLLATTRAMWTRELTSRRRRRALFEVAAPRLAGFDDGFGMLDDTAFNAVLREAVGELTFADARLPLAVVATDLRDGSKVVLREGRLFDALRASVAIPFLIPAWTVNGRRLVDGCLSDPLPVDVAIRASAEVILAIGFESPYQSRVDSIARYAFQVLTVMTNQLMRSNYAFHNLAHHGEVVSVIPEFRERVGAFDTDKVPYLVEEGERAMRERLPYVLDLLAAKERGA